MKCLFPSPPFVIHQLSPDTPFPYLPPDTPRFPSLPLASPTPLVSPSRFCSSFTRCGLNDTRAHIHARPARVSAARSRVRVTTGPGGRIARRRGAAAPPCVWDAAARAGVRRGISVPVYQCRGAGISVNSGAAQVQECTRSGRSCLDENT